MQMFTKQIFYIEFQKHITLLKAKLLAKIIERSIGNKEIVVKKKVMFLVNSYHILVAHVLL